MAGHYVYGVRGHKRPHGIGRSGEDLGHWGGAMQGLAYYLPTSTYRPT
jgi:hypothetical protein